MKLQIVVAALALAASFVAQADEKLAQSKACMACHATDKKLIGPAYQDVAKKYVSDKDAVAKLVASIKAGGAGKWGPIPMPAQTALTDAEAKTLAAWVMGMAK
jgi:cytochrome c